MNGFYQFGRVNLAIPDYRITHFGYDTAGGAFSGVSEIVRIQ